MCGAVGFPAWGLLSGCLDCQLAGKEPAAGQDGERHRGITQLPVPVQRACERLGWRLCPGSLSGCSHLGCPLHSRVAPLLFRMLPGFCGLVGLMETERGPLAAGQGAGEQGKACSKESLCWLPAGVLGKKSLWSAYALELGQESSHVASHWAVFSGC